MGYIISFFLGVFVATVGFSNVALVIDKTVHKAQIYMIESVKISPRLQKPEERSKYNIIFINNYF